MAAAAIGRAALRLGRKAVKKKAKKAVSKVDASKYVKKTGKPEPSGVSERKRRRAREEIVARREGYGVPSSETSRYKTARREASAQSVKRNAPRTKASRETEPFNYKERMTPGESRRLEQKTKESAAARKRTTRRRRAAGGAAAAAGAGAAARRRRRSNSFSDPRGR